MHRIFPASILAILFLFSHQTNAATSLTDEEIQDFKWYDTLGFPKLDGAQYVHVATGRWSQSGNGPRQNQFVNAFLLNSDPAHFTVFTTAAATVTLVPTNDKAADFQRVAYEPANLQNDAKAELDALLHPNPDVPERMWAHFGERLSERCQVFILARACALNGLDQLAHDLSAQAEAMPADRGNAKVEDTFRNRLANDFAQSQIWQAFLDFGDPKIDRAALLKTFHDLVEHFPDTQYTPRATETANLLDKMVKEDQAHAKATTRPIDQLPLNDRIAELIFQLRDQNGQQWSQPGACDIFQDPRLDKSPAAQLVAIGFDAVPQLIDAITDDRFTRSVGYHRNFYFSHFVLRVGDCAEAILSCIAGRQFWVPRNTSAAMLKDGQAADSKKQAQEWWDKVQKIGEKQVLIDAVATGDDNSAQQATRLADKYPDAALPAIITGLAKTQADWQRVQMIETAGSLKGDAPLPFLTDQLTKGESIDARVAAARAVRARGKPQALTAMIDEYNHEADAVEGRDTQAPESLVQFLVSTNDPDAINAIKKRIQVWPVSSRLDIVESLGQTQNMFVMASGPGSSLSPGAATQPSPATLDAIEDLLITELDDTEERGGMSGGIGDESFQDPRVCDMAALSLSTHFSKLYTFHFAWPLAQRDRNRVILQNTYRQRHNLPALPVPELPKVQPIPHSQIDPLIKLLASPAPEISQKAAADIESLGVGAVPPLLETIKSLPKDDNRAAVLTPIVQRLSCRVTQIEILPADFKPNPDLKSALDALHDKPLTRDTFIAVLTAYAKNPQGFGRLKLYATRGDDFTGITLRADLSPGPFPDGDIEESVSAATDHLLNMSGEASIDSLQKPDGWSELSHALDKALTYSPETTLQVRVSVSHK